MTDLPSGTTPHEVAEQLANAMAAMDIEAFRRVFADDYVVWHNSDQKIQTLNENLAFLTQILKNFSSLRYVDIKRELTETGYVQQHILIGEHIDGRSFALPCCHIVQVRDGKITRIDEYFDPAPLTAFMQD